MKRVCLVAIGLLLLGVGGVVLLFALADRSEGEKVEVVVYEEPGPGGRTIQFVALVDRRRMIELGVSSEEVASAVRTVIDAIVDAMLDVVMKEDTGERPREASGYDERLAPLFFEGIDYEFRELTSHGWVVTQRGRWKLERSRAGGK